MVKFFTLLDSSSPLAIRPPNSLRAFRYSFWAFVSSRVFSDLVRRLPSDMMEYIQMPLVFW